MTIQDIINFLKEKKVPFQFSGNSETEIKGFSSLTRYLKATLTWIKKESYFEAAGRPTDIACAIVEDSIDTGLANAISVPHSKQVFFDILHEFWGTKYAEGVIGEGTMIAKEAQIDPTASIGCNCTITGNVQIGAHTVIEHNVVIMGDIRIGEDCLIHSGVVIGTDGYGFAVDDVNMPHKVEHFGGVSIGNDVELGANVCIDRGTIDDTTIGNHVKIDNLVHIAHNVQIGDKTMIIANTCIGGSAVLGEESYIAPGATVMNQARVGRNGFVGMGAVVNRDVNPGMIVVGMPAKEIREVKAGDK